jgi:hypothetical protein
MSSSLAEVPSSSRLMFASRRETRYLADILGSVLKSLNKSEMVIIITFRICESF